MKSKEADLLEKEDTSETNTQSLQNNGVLMT